MNTKKHGSLKSVIYLILILVVLLNACSIQKTPDGPGVTKAPVPPETSIPASTIEPSEDVSSPVTDVETILANLSLEEKVGQMFFIASRVGSDGQKQLAMDEQLSELLRSFKPGGFILFSENLDTIPQTTALVKAVKEATEIAPFIGIDEEGGVVTRLNSAEKLHSTIMPDPFAIGSTQNPDYAFKASLAIAEEIKSLGINMNFAPVADVFSNPNNKVIGRRAYGIDANLVSKMVAQAVRGTLEAGIIPVLKHFPGHGDTLQDSHSGAAIVENDLDRLKKVEFLPFRAGMEAGAQVVMTAHVLTPKITQDGLPATLSPGIIQGLLRKELGFDGLIITDGLEMSAVSSFYPEEEAVVLAVEAGVDMLLLPKDFKKAFNALIGAVKEGRLTEQRIDESVRRILKVKAENIMGKPNDYLDAEKVLGSKEHRDLAEEIIKQK